MLIDSYPLLDGSIDNRKNANKCELVNEKENHEDEGNEINMDA